MARLSRFQYKRNSGPDKKLLLSVFLFLLIIILLYTGIASLSEGTRQRQKTNLEQALNRSVAHYYAVEGHYPENLADLKESYALIYDEETFFVDYRLQGANIFPDITIIEEVD